MSHDLHAPHRSPAATKVLASGPLGWYQRIPLPARILTALLLGVLVGELMGAKADVFKPFTAVVLRLLGALATPLIFVAVLQAILKTAIQGKTGFRLAGLLLLNTVVAIIVGLLVANLLQPGHHAHISAAVKAIDKTPFDPVEDLLGKLPGSIAKPFVENDIMSIIIIALALGIAVRKVRGEITGAARQTITSIETTLDLAFRVIMTVLHWVIELVPFAVFGVVAQKVGTQGIRDAFAPLIWFIASVLLALAIQSAYYLARVRFGSWVRPGQFLRGGSEALLTAFSTASSAATLPITFRCMREKIGVRDESASLGVMVGGAFNHDGTALYEAMAALFVSQLLGQQLGLGHQLLLVFMAVTASVGAAGIPEAGLVTMLAVFKAVHLPVEYIPVLLVVDWFLDRCRTTINVMGDMSVTCLLDGKTRTMSGGEAFATADAERALLAESAGLETAPGLP